MPSITSLFTGLSGLQTNSRRLDAIGNNIANVNTTAFKSNRMMSNPTFSRNLSLGTSPNATTGGTNPGQIGLGATIAGTQRNFANGAISPTGVATDIAMEGDGFFIVDAAGERFFTRNGAFQRNENNDLVTITGGRVMGFAVDNQFQVVEGNLVELNIPVGTLTLAEASRNVTFNGNLNASGTPATTGSVHESRAFLTSTGPDVLLSDASIDLTVDSLWIDDGAGGNFLAFDAADPGAILTVSGVEKGGKDLGDHTFQFTSTPGTSTADATGTTLQDYLDWLGPILGLNNTTIDGQELGGTVELDVTTGQIIITGNEGTVQNLDIDTSDVVLTNNGAGISSPFVMTKTGEANGESVRTSFVVFDSLGTPLTVDLTFVLQEAVDGEGTTWEFLAESSDSAAQSRVTGLGVVEFDSNGKFVSATNQSFALVRDNGAVSPLVVNMNFDTGTDAISALSDSSSEVAAVFQDGSAIGTLSAFSIGDDGVISGAFTNGLTRSIGQIAVAKFANAEGLVDVGNSLFRTGPNSGTALVTKPLEFGTGRMVGGALELSNVELSQEFINMILASTGYSAASRVISTTDELIDQLLVLGR